MQGCVTDRSKALLPLNTIVRQFSTIFRAKNKAIWKPPLFSTPFLPATRLKAPKLSRCGLALALLSISNTLGGHSWAPNGQLRIRRFQFRLSLFETRMNTIMSHKPNAQFYTLLAALLAFGPVAANADGFRLPNQDPDAIARGNAFVATADNPSAIYYNPAGITQLEGQNIRAGMYLVSR